MKKNKPTFAAESICVAGDFNTTYVELPRPMPCVVIFVHGVNSEGEWYLKTENGLNKGLNERLGRIDLRANDYSPDNRTLVALQNSPVIRFFWGYRAPQEQTANGTFPYRIPLKTREPYISAPGCTSYRYPSYSFNHPETNRPGSYYWGGGPFQNGTTALNMSWYDGFDPEVLGGLIDVGSPYINPEPGRPLNAAPPRTYYVNASKRLADLIDSVYERYPNDTVAVVSHSQGTMVAALAMLYVKRVPDTLFLCNSPYCFSDKGLDGLTMGTQAPTSGSRVRTFFNILDRFKQSQ
jgi:pimeloyl-ACP methyl ester carboxylesterase